MEPQNHLDWKKTLTIIHSNHQPNAVINLEQGIHEFSFSSQHVSLDCLLLPPQLCSEFSLGLIINSPMSAAHMPAVLRAGSRAGHSLTCALVRGGRHKDALFNKHNKQLLITVKVHDTKIPFHHTGEKTKAWKSCMRFSHLTMAPPLLMVL